MREKLAEATVAGRNGGCVLQPWVSGLGLRHQGVLLAATRGCDTEPKVWTRKGVSYSPGRRLTAFVRWCFMVPADAREVDAEEGAFMMSSPPDPFRASEFGHLPEHWYAHSMHALQVIGCYHPSDRVRLLAYDLYAAMVRNLHLRCEPRSEMDRRLREDRIAGGNVVS